MRGDGGFWKGGRGGIRQSQGDSQRRAGSQIGCGGSWGSFYC